MPTDIQIVKPDLIIEGNDIATPKRAALNFINATVTDDAINNQTNVTIPPSGITIGTTPITSGVAGRVLFEGAGNVAQEDAGFSFNQTTKALTLTSDYVATGVPTLNIIGSGLNVCPYYRVVSDGGVSEATLVATRTGGASAGGINRAFLSLSNAAGGHNVISSNDGLAFSAAGHTAYSSVNDQMRLKNGNLGIGTGYSATARLDIKAQGALSTDIALRVRNSADTVNNFQVNGNNSIYMLGDGDAGAIRLTRQTGHSTLLQHRSSNTLPSIFTIASYAQGGSEPQIKFDTLFGDGGTPTFTIARLIFGLSDLTANSLWSPFGASTATAFTMKNSLGYVGYGTIPTGTPTDHFAMYSADIVAGNAAPHFRTENGSVIKLYKQNLPTNPTNAELATFLSNLGLANLI